MNTEIWLAIIAIVAAPAGSALTARLMKRKYDTEIKKLQTEVEGMKADVRANELENVSKGVDILMAQIVTPLEKQVEKLNANVRKLEKAIGKISTCHYATECPVTRELHGAEKSSQLTEPDTDRRGTKHNAGD